MPTMKPPRDPRVSGETVGPNSPDTVDPRFGDEWRDRGGDVGRVGRVTGRETERDQWGYPMPATRR